MIINTGIPARSNIMTWELYKNIEIGCVDISPERLGLISHPYFTLLGAARDAPHHYRYGLHGSPCNGVLNGNVLDALIKHPELIPRAWWDGRVIAFPGTVYFQESRIAGREHPWTTFVVRCLYYEGRPRWAHDIVLLKEAGRVHPVAVLK